MVNHLIWNKYCDINSHLTHFQNVLAPLNYTVYGKKCFHSKESDTKILQSIYCTYNV